MYSYKNIPLALTLFLLILQSCFSQNKRPPLNTAIPNYTVTIAEENIRKVVVDASLPLLSDTLYMSQSEFAPLPDGYAAFVHGLEATDAKGQGIKLTTIGKGIWKVDTHIPSTIHLKYSVTIGHDNVQWATSGAFAKAYVVDNVLFFAGRVLFIAAAGADSSKIQVRFNLPKGWDVATPYNDIQNDPGTFVADDLSTLWRNGSFLGDFERQEINVGKLKVVIAGTHAMKEGLTLFKSALSKIISSYSSAMGGAPEGKLVIMGSVSSMPPGGEAFNRSISVSFMQTPGMGNKGRWGYLLSHEAFHLWNGQAISPADQSQVEWFVEGFTEYMSKLTAFRTGFISEAEYLQQLSQCRNSYLSLGGKVSLVKAGLQKGMNYSLIYDGGMSVALALDIEIHRSTGNKKGFINIMREMYTRYGKTTVPYKYDDIIKVCSEIAGHDLSAFFTAYISGTQLIPLDKYLGYAGLQASQGGDIQLNANATTAEKDLLKTLLGD
ncbi:hypothetical protein BH09BAC6_BH09BAC6_11210 [soil metagenome]